MADFQAAFRAGADDQQLRMLVELSNDPPAVIAKLARSPDAEIRSWVAHVLPDLVTARVVERAMACGVLKDLALGDTDSDLRDEALRTLLIVDTAAARDLLPRIRRRLRSNDYYAPVVAMWVFAELGDRAAIPQIQDYRERTGSGTWQGRQARIVQAVLEDDTEGLARQIESHDHDMTHALCRAVRLLPAPRLLDALQLCAEQFDAECADRCRATLDAVRDNAQRGRESGATG